MNEYVCDCCGAVGVQCVSLRQAFSTTSISKVCSDCESVANRLLEDLRKQARTKEINEMKGALYRRQQRAKKKAGEPPTRAQNVISAFRFFWKAITP